MISGVKSNGEFKSAVGSYGFPIMCLFFFVSAIGFNGCASRSEILSFKENSEYIRTKLDTVNLNLQNLRMQVDAVQMRQDRLVEDMATQSDVRQFKAYMGSRLDDYEGQGLMLSAQINDLSQRLTGVAQSVDEMKYQTPRTIPTDSLEATIIINPELRQLYDQAYFDLTRGNYDLAKSGFSEYLKIYPDTELADNALYWLGETEYVNHNYERAKDIFAQICEKYPNGNKLPAALFKVGLCQITLKQVEEAKATFGELIQNHPATPEASQAEERLKELE
ncbi:tol-pal system protein YbgF [candidate division LCP-89 bacterium B3_LCP]|uniref:Tol-pal system protein YbgF n=1 Tax=candidate division LCP-89 bacterium B3_LCP TaxID=2012998 RepID=A0A532V5A2_UNCL8|nr:MAG: tol-pal system protein YbgF [candidate division LCP-89 bacterium B3_LCP]